MTKEQLDELQSLLDKATPGPWNWKGENPHTGDITVMEESRSAIEHIATYYCGGYIGHGLTNAKLATALRNHAQELIDAARDLRRVQRLPALDTARAKAVIMQIAAKLAKMEIAGLPHRLQDAVDQWATYTTRIENEGKKLRGLLEEAHKNMCCHPDSPDPVAWDLNNPSRWWCNHCQTYLRGVDDLTLYGRVTNALSSPDLESAKALRSGATVNRNG